MVRTQLNGWSHFCNLGIINSCLMGHYSIRFAQKDQLRNSTAHHARFGGRFFRSKIRSIWHRWVAFKPERDERGATYRYEDKGKKSLVTHPIILRSVQHLICDRCPERRRRGQDIPLKECGGGERQGQTEHRRWRKWRLVAIPPKWEREGPPNVRQKGSICL